MTWRASNENIWATTIGEPASLPFWYVISDSGILLERDDGEVKRFTSSTRAMSAALRLNRPATPKENTDGNQEG